MPTMKTRFFVSAIIGIALGACIWRYALEPVFDMALDKATLRFYPGYVHSLKQRRSNRLTAIYHSNDPDIYKVPDDIKKKMFDSLSKRISDYQKRVIASRINVFEALDLANICQREGLESGYFKVEGVCRHQSIATYDLFQDLAAFLGRKDLIDNVRIVVDWDDRRYLPWNWDKKYDGQAHMWLQYRFDNKSPWLNYESQESYPDDSIGDSSRLRDRIIARDGDQLHRRDVDIATKPGTLEFEVVD